MNEETETIQHAKVADVLSMIKIEITSDLLRTACGRLVDPESRRHCHNYEPRRLHGTLLDKIKVRQ